MSGGEISRPERFCPGCDELMEPLESVQGVEVEVCPGCRGVWFDQGELRAFRRAQGLPHEAGRVTIQRSTWTGEVMGCPRCDTSTLRLGRRGRESIGHCVNCGGLFLDSLESASSKALLKVSPEYPTFRWTHEVARMVIFVAALFALAILLGVSY